MNADEENEVVNASTRALMQSLTAGGKPVEAVVTVVLFKGGQDYSISATIDPSPESEEEADRRQGGVMLAASDLLDDHVHDRGLCAACNEKKGPVH